LVPCGFACFQVPDPEGVSNIEYPGQFIDGAIRAGDPGDDMLLGCDGLNVRGYLVVVGASASGA